MSEQRAAARLTSGSRPDVGRVLDLAPGGVRPGPVGRADLLRDDALQAHRTGMPKQGLAVGTRDMAGEPERIRCLAHKLRETSGSFEICLRIRRPSGER